LATVLLGLTSPPLSPEAVAAEIIVDFVGEVLHAQGAAVGGPFQAGGAVTGRIVYDPVGAVDTLPSDPESGRYAAGTMRSFDLTVGSYEAVGNLLSSLGYVGVRSEDRPATPDYTAVAFRAAATGASVGGLAPSAMQFEVNYFGPRPLLTDAIPDSADLLAMRLGLPTSSSCFACTNFLTFGGPGLDRVDWTMTSYTVIPEPNTAVLLCSALALLAARRRMS